MTFKDNLSKPQINGFQDKIIQVLCIDDENEFVTLLRHLLQKMSNDTIKADICFNAQEGLTRLENKNFDVVVSDYQMPEMNGLEFLEVLRKKGNTIPFIILTGCGREELVIQALNLGVDLYLQKGGDIKTTVTELIHMISNISIRKQTELKYQTLVENSPDRIAIVDRNGILIYINRTSSDYSLDDTIGKSVYDYMPSDSAFIYKQGLQKMFQTGNVTRTKIKTVRKDYFEIRFIPLIEGVKITNAMIIGTNINKYEKMGQTLQEANEQLKKSEKSLKKQTHDLRERSKEVSCLYGVTTLATDSNRSLDEKLQNIVEELIPSAWQYPEITVARLKIENKSFTTRQFQETQWKQSAEIVVSEKKIGKLEIYYQKAKPIMDEGPFSKEERNLINALAIEISKLFDHLEMKENLKESEERLRDFMESSTEGFVLFNPDMDYIDLNKAFLKHFPTETQKEDIIGKNILDVVPNLKKTGRYDMYLEVLRTGEPLYIENFISDSKFENKYIQLRAFKVGRNIGMITTDISKRKIIEKSLKESEERLRGFMDSATEGFSLFDSEFNFLDINQAGLNFWPFDFQKDEIIGKNLEDLIPNFKNSERYLEYLNVIKTGKPFMSEDIIPHPMFGNVYLNLNVFKVGDGLGFIISDITKRKKSEILLRQQREELSEFAHQMVHDSRNSLLAIQGYADLLENDGEKNYAPKIKQITGRFQELLNRSIELADAGLVVKETDNINLNALVMKVAQNVLPENVNFISTGLPFVLCDRLKVMQLFQNLFENAVTHGKASKIEVTYNQNTISIKNDGIPIPDKYKLKIFQKGFTTLEGNSGIGLVIVNKIVEAHNWKITLKSDEMTVFCINISLKR